MGGGRQSAGSAFALKAWERISIGKTPMRFWSIAAVGESSMRLLLIVATAWSLCTGPAFAQVEDPLDPLTAVPSLSATSPLGIGANGSVGLTGLPMGATEINSAGVSPAPTGSVTGTIAIPTSGSITTGGTACSTGGMSASGTFGSAASFDGGGAAAGSAAPATAATTGSMATSGATGTLPTAATTDPMTTPGTSTSSEMSVPLGTTSSAGMLGTSGMWRAG